MTQNSTPCPECGGPLAMQVAPIKSPANFMAVCANCGGIACAAMSKLEVLKMLEKATD